MTRQELADKNVKQCEEAVRLLVEDIEDNRRVLKDLQNRLIKMRQILAAASCYSLDLRMGNLTENTD